MKKFLPLTLLVFGVVVMLGAYFLVIKGKKVEETPVDENKVLLDVPLEKRPIVSLTPTSDGHYLNMKIEKIFIDNASSLDYELIYKLASGISQGVPGTVDIKGKKEFEAEVLLGSESSGKFRYDEGVNEGTLTLRFRDDKGKLMTKFTTEFSLSSNKDNFSTPNGEFSITLNKVPKKEYFVLMETWGIPDYTPTTISKGPYGLFSSTDTKQLLGRVSMGESKVFMHITGPRWEEFEDVSTLNSDTGIFYGSSE